MFLGIEENIGTVDLDLEHPHDSPDEDDDDLPCKYESSPLSYHPHDHFSIVLSHSVRTL